MIGISAYLALGSNLGDREKTLSAARDLISERIGIIQHKSKLYDTEPEGFVSESRFLNQVVEVHTGLNPLALLSVAKEIEKKLGRIQKSTDGIYHDRTCDIDIILYGPMIWQSAELEIPHPRFRDRLFVLRPLLEIAPEIVDPVTQKNIAELYNGQAGSTGCRP